MDFVIGLQILTDWKKNNYDSIFVIVDWLIKIVYYKLVKVIINTLRLAKNIIYIVVRHYSFPNSIVPNLGLLFISKF